jgi:RHS repeat-associated protein
MLPGSHLRGHVGHLGPGVGRLGIKHFLDHCHDSGRKKVSPPATPPRHDRQMVDSVGNVTTSTDPLGHSTTYVYDVLNRKTQTVDARGGIVTTLYDAVGNNTTVVDQVGNTTTMAFDVLNRMTQQTAPLNHSSTMAFDALGRQTSATDRNGQVINTTYDNDNRVLTQIWKNSGDTTVNTLTYSYDSAGNELTAANGSGPYTMSYDTLNRATLTKEPFGVTLTSAYDALSRRTLLKDSLGGTITSTYDNVGNLTDRQFSASGMTTLDVSLGYTALNQLASITRTVNPPSPFSTFTSLTYDAVGRLTFLKHYDNAVPPPHGGHTFETITYTYDAASRLSTEVRNGTTTTYQYDATNELTNDTANSYSYDLAGNRTMTGYTTGSANELTNDGMWTYSYDNNGNMTKKSKGASAETWYFGYDNLNRMTSAKQEQTDGGTLLMQATYVYDVLGDRIEKDVWTSSTGTVVTRFAYDGQNAFADLNSSNQLQMRRLYGDAVDQLFARENSSGTLAWYLTDRLGSVRDVLNASSTVIDHIDYDGFGNATETNSANGDRYKWTDREFDSETGLQYNRARLYSAAIGRWLTQDPIGFLSGDVNLYWYVENDSLNLTDPLGKWWENAKLYLKITGALTGGGLICYGVKAIYYADSWTPYNKSPSQTCNDRCGKKDVGDMSGCCEDCCKCMLGINATEEKIAACRDGCNKVVR